MLLPAKPDIPTGFLIRAQDSGVEPRARSHAKRSSLEAPHRL